MVKNRALDRWLVDSFGWRLFVRQTLAWDVLSKAALPNEAKILDVGGGAGASAAALRSLLPGCWITVAEPDPKMASLAKRRLSPHGERVRVDQEDATKLPYPEASFDAALCFEVLHHIADWRGALQEIRRVLKPGGALLVAEALKDLISLPVLKTLFPHPQEGHFSAEELKVGLAEAGFSAAPGSFVVHGGAQLAGVARR